jgi:AAA domain
MAQTTAAQFDKAMYQAALAFYGLPPNYKRAFKRVQRTDKATGQPLYKANGEPDTTLIGANASYASTHSEAVWVQVNTPHDSVVTAKGNPKRAYNKEIKRLANIVLDFEYPQNPACAHRIGIALAHYLEQHGLAEPGLPVEDSGGGCHIVLPLPPNELTEETAERWNAAVRSVVKKHIEPEFQRLVAAEQVEMDLSGFDISRVLSAPGTWRPPNPKKPDCEALRQGYLRRWLAPYTNGVYPERRECAKLADLIRAEYAQLNEPAAPHKDPLQGPTSSQWLAEYAAKHPNSDRSAHFQSLVNAIRLKYGKAMVWMLKDDINALSGGKYNGRLDEEIKRSLSTAGTSEAHQTSARQHIMLDRLCDLQRKELPDIRWAIEPILPEGLTILAGSPKMGKSWLALAVLAAIAAGGVALGQYPVEQGEVLYIALEDGEKRLKNRANTVLGNALASPDFYYKTEWPRLDEGGLAELERILGEHPRMRLVCIDTWARFKPRPHGGRANQYDEDYEAVGPLQSLASQKGVSIVIVDHVRKQESEDPVDMISGTHGKSGGVDGFLVLYRKRQEDDARLFVYGRDVEQDDELQLSFNRECATWTVKGNVGSDTVAPTAARQEILDELAKHEDGLTCKELTRALGRDKESTVRNLIAKMREKVILENGRFILVSMHSKRSNHSKDSKRSNHSKTAEQVDSEPEVTTPSYGVTTAEPGSVVTSEPVIAAPVEPMQSNGHQKVTTLATLTTHVSKELPHCTLFSCLGGPNRTQWRLSGYYCPVHGGMIDEEGRPI